MPSDLSLTKVESFIELVTQGVDAWVKAGAMLCELVAEHGLEILRTVERLSPGLNRDTLDLFLSIGRKEIYPMLALDNSVGATALAGLSYDDQERYYKEGVPVADADGGVEIIPVSELSAWDCKQVFDLSTIRTVKEQVKWIEEREIERSRRQAFNGSRPKRAAPICKGDTSGFEPDKETPRINLDSLKSATPLELLRLALDHAHSSMMDARRHLSNVKPNSLKDDLISHALNAIGKLRFAVANNEL